MTKHGSPHPSFGDLPHTPRSPFSGVPTPDQPVDPSPALAAARVSLGRDHAVLEADAGFEDLLGLAGDELCGRSIFDFIFPAERRAVADRLNYAVACRHDRIGCLALRRPDDHAVHIDAVLRYETTGGEGLWLRCSRLTGTLVAAAGPHGDGSATAATTATAATAPATHASSLAPSSMTPSAVWPSTAIPSTPSSPSNPAPVPAPVPLTAVDDDGLDDASRQVLRLEDVRGGAMLVVGAAGQVLAGTSAAATRIGWPVELLTGQTVDSLFVLSPPAREQLHDAVRSGRRQMVPASIVGGLALANLEWLPAQRAGYGFLSILSVQMTAGSDEHTLALQQAVRLLWHDAGDSATALVLGTENLASLLGADGRRPGAASMAGVLIRHARMIHQAMAEVRRVENGTPVELEPVDLNDTITAYVAAVQPSAAAASITLRTELATGVFVRSTELRIRSIVRNLVTNACQALASRPGGGTVEITTAPADGESGPGVQLVVRDDGPGMSDALSRVIFEPGLSNRHGGTGVGLNLVRQFIVESGGAVQPLSRPGEGTAFVIWLPTVPPDGVAPDSVGPDSVAPDSVAPDGVSPDGVSPDGFSPDSAPTENRP